MSKSGFNNNFSYDPNIYGTIFEPLATTEYNQPYQLRNANGKRAEKNFDTIMTEGNVDFINAHTKDYKMKYRHFNGFGWIPCKTSFYTDRVVGPLRKQFFEIKNSITDMHHPSKIILEAISVKITHPDSEFYLYVDTKCFSSGKAFLESSPLIDGIIVGPVELKNFINNGCKLPNKKSVSPINLFI